MWPFKHNQSTEEHPHNLRKILALTNVFAVLFSWQFVGPQIMEKFHWGTPPANCEQVFELAMDSENAVVHLSPNHTMGYFECFTQPMQTGYFTNNGWNSDADVQAWFDSLSQQGIIFHVREFAGDPIIGCVTDPYSGVTNCDAKWLLYIDVYTYEAGNGFDQPARWVHDTRDSTSATLTVNDQGLITGIQ